MNFSVMNRASTQQEGMEGRMSAFPVPEHLKLENQLSSVENTQLIKSVASESLHGVEQALKKGAKVNFFFRPDDQKAALHIAAENGSYDIAKFLIKNGALPDIISIPTGSTPLHLAASNLHAKCAQLLLSEGANALAQNSYGNTPLHLSLKESTKTDSQCVDLLLPLIDDNSINIQNNQGSTVLHMACHSEHLPIGVVKSLLSKGADIHCRDKKGRPAILSCCASGRFDILQLLLEKGADPTVRDDSGMAGAEVCEFHGFVEMSKKYFN